MYCEGLRRPHATRRPDATPTTPRYDPRATPLTLRRRIRDREIPRPRPGCDGTAARAILRPRHRRQLEHQASAPHRRSRREPPAMIGRDRGGDRQTATPPPSPAACAGVTSSATRRRQARVRCRSPRRVPGVPVAAPVNLDDAATVLDRVRDQVAGDLREPEPVSPHGRAGSRPRRPQREPRAAAAGRHASTESLTSCARSIASGGRDHRAPRPHGLEVVEHERGAAELEVDRAQTRRRAARRRRRRRSSPSLTAVSGPRNSWHARATVSIRHASARHTPTAANPAALAASQPASSTAITARGSRRRAGSRRPTR